MAYDAQKAHEYYEKYRKKGLKKGRKKGQKKGTSKKGKSESLKGLAAGGLNDAGKMEWAIQKDELSKQMNAALKNAKSDEEKAAIKREYQQKALDALTKLKNDPSTMKQKSAKSNGSSGSGSSGGSKSSKGDSPKPKKKNKGSMKQQLKKRAERLAAKKEALSDKIEKITEKLQTIPPDEKARLRKKLEKRVERLKKRLKKYE